MRFVIADLTERLNFSRYAGIKAGRNERRSGGCGGKSRGGRVGLLLRRHSTRRSTEPRVQPPASRRIQKTRDVTSGQVNFGCDQSLPVETPIVYFGKNSRDIDSRPAWANTDNVKTQNQSPVKVETSPDHPSGGIKAAGTISGRDSQNILAVKNCPGADQGELTLHVTWTEDEWG